MQQAAELLADMHREQQSAADALEAMCDLLATAAAQEASELLGGAPRAAYLGDLPRRASMQKFVLP